MLTRSWVQVLTGGVALWAVSTVFLIATDDPVLLPTVVLTGSFLVPVAMIFWFLDRTETTELTPRRLLVAFFVAGIIGLLTAAALEVWLLPSRLFPNVWVGLIEEATKAVGVIVLATGLRRYVVRDGVVLGVVVGLGFGAFESAGYTLNSGFDNGTFSIENLISEEILRAVIAPFCHGLWTGLFGAAWFAAGARPTFGVLGAYLGVSTLHALWDAASTAGIVVTVLASGDETQREAIKNWSLPPISVLTPQWLFGVVEWTVMALVAIAGSLLVRHRWLHPPGVKRDHPPGHDGHGREHNLAS
jgi:RsiW-degrading membrane proteinase PrsW (M82 family)